MKEVTIDNVRERIAELDCLDKAGVISLRGGFELACLRKLVESLEAEAVGEVVLGEYDDCGCHPDAKVVCISADGQADWENFKDGTRLYTAPPAPVSVPDEREAFNTWNNDTDCPLAGRDAKTAAWLAWCRRAAMLQGADGNAPVSPDGWLLVPVEPTMSQEFAGYRTLTDTGKMSRLMKTRLSNIYRAMIATAPQQEVTTDNTAQQFEALAGSQAEDDMICYGERCLVCDEMIIGRSPDGMCVSCRDESTSAGSGKQ